MREKERLVWVESGGGPLILVSAGDLRHWSGVQPPADGRWVHAVFRLDPAGPATDYDRACDVHDYLGILEVGHGTALVLSGEPLPTCWWPRDDRRQGWLVRWGHADSDAEAEAALRHAGEPEWESETLPFHVADPVLYLFDSAVPGTHVISHFDELEVLRIVLEPGDYVVRTAWLEPDTRTQLLLHELSRRGTGP